MHLLRRICNLRCKFCLPYDLFWTILDRYADLFGRGLCRRDENETEISYQARARAAVSFDRNGRRGELARASNGSQRRASGRRAAHVGRNEGNVASRAVFERRIGERRLQSAT